MSVVGLWFLPAAGVEGSLLSRPVAKKPWLRCGRRVNSMAETVRDVLNRARTFHGKLCDLYGRMSDIAEKERVKLVLNYMSRHEHYMDECLSAFEKGANKQVLETWYKYTSPKSTVAALEGIELRTDMTVEDVLKVAMRLDECLVDLYRGMAEGAPSAELRSLFQELLELENMEQRQLVRDAVEMEDL
jgi:hypothetical protein